MEKDGDNKKNNNKDKNENQRKIIEKSIIPPKSNNIKDINKEKDKDKDKKNKKKEYKIFYSAYGYIKVDKAKLEKNAPVVDFIQFRQAPYNPDNCLFGTISVLNCIKEINIQIKTFYNERAMHTIEKIDIFSTLQFVVKRMFEQIKNEKILKEKEDKPGDGKEKKDCEYEEEVITEHSQYRIFSCHKQIHELNQTRNMFENDIQNDEILLYLPIKKLSFSESMKGNSITISQEGKIASKFNTDDPQYVLGNIAYSFGKHYFEVNLLTEPIAKSVIIGLATKRNPGDMFINDVHNFYGYILSDMQKISSINGKQEKKEYTKTTIGINDIIGVMFEFKKEGLEISFYKNKICLGVAFSKIYSDKIFFPAISLGIAGSKIQISNQIDFPDTQLNKTNP